LFAVSSWWTGQPKAQAEFIAWWDRQAKNKGAAQRRSTNQTALKAGENGIPNREVLHRWRKSRDQGKDQAASRKSDHFPTFSDIVDLTIAQNSETAVDIFDRPC
jgi:hypothetical protein